MLEALIRTKLTSGEPTQRRRGDILAVKLYPARWTAIELERFGRCQWEDRELEFGLRDSQRKGEADPCIALPYRYTAAGKIVSESAKGVNWDSVPERHRVKSLSQREPSPLMEWGEFEVRDDAQPQ
jgi:hypothetical protein